MVEGLFTERVKRANAGLWGQLKPEGQLEKKAARRRSKPTFNQDRGCLRKPETSEQIILRARLEQSRTGRGWCKWMNFNAFNQKLGKSKRK